MENKIPKKILRDSRNKFLSREENSKLIIQCTHVIFILEDIEKDIYNSIDGSSKLLEIINKLSDQYEVDRNIISKDISEFIIGLKEKGLVSF